MAAPLRSMNPDGIFKTEDGGMTWEEQNIGLTNTIVYPLTLDPTNSENVFVGTGYGRDTASSSGGGMGVYKSTDSGETWFVSNLGLPEDVIVNDIKFHPTNNNIYISTDRKGIWFSTDLGSSWIYSGLDGTSIYILLPIKLQWQIELDMFYYIIFIFLLTDNFLSHISTFNLS